MNNMDIIHNGVVIYCDDNVVEIRDNTGREVQILHYGNITPTVQPGTRISCVYRTEYVEGFDTDEFEPEYTCVSYAVEGAETLDAENLSTETISTETIRAKTFHCVVADNPGFRRCNNGETQIHLNVTRQIGNNLTIDYTLVDTLTINNAPFYETVRPGVQLSVTIGTPYFGNTCPLESIAIGKLDPIAEEANAKRGETETQRRVRVNDFGAVQPKDVAKLVS